MKSVKIISSGVWQLLNVGIFSALNIAYLMIMARNVDKIYHGSFAILFVIMTILSMVSRSGFGPAIVRREFNTDQQISFAFYGSLFSGLVVSIIFYILSPLIVSAYGGGLDLFFVRLSSLYFLFLSVGMVPYALIVRRMHFKKMLIAQCMAFLIGSIGVGYIMATLGYGFGALVGGLLGFTGLNALFMYLLEPHSLKLDFSIKEGKEVFHFSLGIILSDLLSSGAYHVDKLILGKFLPATSLALYEKGQYVTKLPVKIFGNAFDSVIYSVLSNFQTDTNKQNIAFKNSLKMILILSGYLSVLVFCFADSICFMLLGPKWDDTVIVVKIFSISFPFLMLSKLSDAVFRVHDRLYLGSTIKFGFIISIILASFSIIYVDYITTLWIISFCYGIFNIVVTIVTARIQGVKLIELFRNSSKLLMIFLSGAITIILVNKLFTGEKSIWPLLSVLVFHCCAFLLLIYYVPSFFGKETMRNLLGDLEKSKISRLGYLKPILINLNNRL